MFNPLKDHERYSEKDPKDMNMEELRMLLKIRRLDLKLEWKEFQEKIHFWQRVGRTVKQSGILDKFQEGIQSYFTKKEEDSTST